MAAKIVTKATVFIAASRETVWDFTQDYSKRHLWDSTIRSAHLIQEHPRVAFITGMAMLTCELHYKLDDRPVKTSLAMMNTKSPIIAGGGGYWHYEAKDNGTLWTQTNAIVLRQNILSFFIKPIVFLSLKFRKVFSEKR